MTNLWTMAKSGPFLGIGIIKIGIYDYFNEFASEALHIVNFENFVKLMTSCLSELKVTPNKIPDDVTATSK